MAPAPAGIMMTGVTIIHLRLPDIKLSKVDRSSFAAPVTIGSGFEVGDQFRIAAREECAAIRNQFFCKVPNWWVVGPRKITSAI